MNHLADCRDHMRSMDWNSVSAIVTDPPYGISFMGKGWDQAVPGPDYWLPARDVLKPGGYLLAFGGTRTFHRLMVGLEDSGFQIVDTLCWLYGQGFPKSHNQGGEWEGWGSALKPGWEPIVLAQKPMGGSIRENLIANGCGALHIDACRIPVEDADYLANCSGSRGHAGTRSGAEVGSTDLRPGGGLPSDLGRWPANVVLDEDAAAVLDQQTGIFKSGPNPSRRSSAKFKNAFGVFEGQAECVPARGEDSGGASRFFYCSKAGRSEREFGCESLPETPLQWGSGGMGTFQSDNTKKSAKNYWPTVKPLRLMRWLVRLVGVPGGVILDPFLGSGTTAMACVMEGFDCIGIEQDPGAFAIAEARTAWALRQREVA